MKINMLTKEENMNTVHLVRNNSESKMIQEKYFKEGFKWWDAGKEIKPLPIGKYGTLIGISKFGKNTMGIWTLNTIHDLEYAKTKVLIVTLNNKNKLEI